MSITHRVILTTIVGILVTVVSTVVVSITAPHAGDALAVLTEEL